jgi:CTP synthase
VPSNLSNLSKKPCFVFTIGGVLSGLGKGVTTASMGLLLKSRGFKVTAVKIDPYISIDAGTMRPAEHGEVFVTRDGGEIDQDLGNYERFLDLSLTKDHNITTGKIFREVINKERSFYYAGRDAELIPDVINEIKEQIFRPLKDEEIVLVEIGGTTGDLENLPFLYAARELAHEYPAIFVMIVYLPFLKNVGELKTKPAQHAMARLREVGIFADLVVTRAEIPLDRPRAETLAKRCFLAEEDIIDNPDLDTIYRMPILFDEEGLVDRVIQKLNLRPGKKDLTDWRRFVERFTKPKAKVKIALVGKYLTHGASVHRDVYISVLEALNHAAARHRRGVEIIPVDAEIVEKQGIEVLEGFAPDGIVVPQGWGRRGVEGKIAAIRFARENKIPFLGLCFGMQMAVIEFARHTLGLEQANSTEVDSKTPHPVVHLMPDQEKYLKNHQYGGTIRLGSWPCQLDRKSLIYEAYRQEGMEKNSPWWLDRQGEGRHPGRGGGLTVFERHRHRYEVNNEYRQRLEEGGLRIVGTSPDGELVEAVELEGHPFFVGTQFHPEYQSRPLRPHPLFVKFLERAGGKL